MSMWDANSDLDHADEMHGPYGGKTVERTCGGCGKTFWMVVEGEYVMHPLCALCERAEANARHQREQEAQDADLAKRMRTRRKSA